MKLRNCPSYDDFKTSLVNTYERHAQASKAYGEPLYDYLVVYDLYRAYGGAEEGGWYYDQGTPIESLEIYDSGSLGQACKKIWDDYHEDVLNSRSYTSVLGGFDVEVAFSYGPGKEYPEETPRYE